jgi:hypothetical protein
VALALLAACGSTTPGNTSPAARSVATPSSSATSSGRSSFEGDPCSLISRSEAQSVVGTAVTATPVNQPSYAGCNYSPADVTKLRTDGILSLVLYPDLSSATWQQVLGRYSQRAGGHPLSGIGDAAIAGELTTASGRSAYISVLKGTTAFVLVHAVYSGAVPPSDSVIRLARAVATRV